MMKYVETTSSGTHSVGYEYDNINNLTALVETINGVERKTSYTYDEDNRPTSISTNGTSRSYTYDGFGRASTDVTKQGDTELFNRTYVYKVPSEGGISNVLSRLRYSGTNLDRSFMVNRDANGNIHYALEGTYINTYEYDSANQLIREDHSITRTTTIWTYDSAGNILTREVYPRCSGTPDPATRISVVNYTYNDDKGWGDLLTAYNGVEITHDDIGNPLNDGTWNYTWQHGRQLASMAKIDESESWQFTYNADGMRTQRKNTVNNRTYNYTYLGGQLTHMTVDGHTMYFAYDASGTPMAVTYDGVNYYYVTNIQGDVIFILNSSNEELVRYIYDAWGNLISTTGTLATTIGFYNPLRYRGYVYDAETGLYYLQSRYYNPEMGRFINADGLASTGQGVLGNNMYSYCMNNPVGAYDPDGKCRRLFFDTLDCKDSTCITSDYYPKPKIVHSFGQKKQRDVTTEIEAALAKGVAEAKSHIHPQNSSQTIKMYRHFYTLVDHGADWDIKVAKSWEKTVGTSFPGQKAYVLYHGSAMTPEMLGNYTYGYLGYAYDIPLEMLILGSYYAAGWPSIDSSLAAVEVWDWKYIQFGYWKAMQDCV